MVPDNSTGISRVPAYSGAAPVCIRLRVRGSHPLRLPIPEDSAVLPTSFERSYNPATGLDRGGLGYSPFARRYWGNRCYFLFLQVLRCFSSLRSPRYKPVPESLPAGCPIRTSAGHGVFATRRSFSQLVTSFFASESPGILHAPLMFRYSFAFATRGRLRLFNRRHQADIICSPFDLLDVKLLLLCFFVFSLDE